VGERPILLPGTITCPNLVFTRGVTKSESLMQWFKQTIKDYDSGQRLFLSTVTVQLIDSRGLMVQKWMVAGALPVKWSGPTLSVDSNSIATETLEISHGGFI
jgi:phage tail-like protein